MYSKCGYLGYGQIHHNGFKQKGHTRSYDNDSKNKLIFLLKWDTKVARAQRI
jgi:hypothetical protein